MLLILNKKLKSYRFKDYVFLPDKPVEVTDDNDIFDLINSGRVIQTDNIFLRNRFQGLLGPREGQLNIGIIRIGGIGDTLQLGAHAKAVKRKYPGSFITAYVRDRVDQEILEHNPHVDRIVQTGLASWDRVVEKHKDKHDIFYDFKYVPKVFYRKNGYEKDKKITDRMFSMYARYNHEFPQSNYELCYKIRTNVINITNEIAGLIGSEDDMEFVLYDTDNVFIKILDNEEYVTIHTGAGNSRVTKLWEYTNWCKIAQYLKQRGYRVIQVGSNYEPEIPGVTSLLGLTSIGQTACLLSGAVFHMGTEGGLVHLAKAVHTHAIVLFGPTPVSAFGYKGNINIRKCNHTACWYSRDDWYQRCAKPGPLPSCMSKIEVEDVEKDINHIIHMSKPKTVKITQKSAKIAVSVITPVLDGHEWVRQELESIFAHSQGIPYEIILVDNGSDAATYKYLQELGGIPNIRVIRNHNNLGYGKANNQGSKIARGKYLLFLNSDTRVGTNFLQDIINAFEQDKNLAALGAAGGYLQDGVNFVHETRNNSETWNYLVGWCLAIRKDVFNKTGGFDEQYEYAFCEDTDLSFKLRHDGYKIKLLEELKITHFGSKTVFKQKDFDPYVETMKNRQKFRNKWFRKKNNISKLKVKRILFVRKCGLGDVLLTFPIVKELKSKYPKSELTFSTDNLCAELLSGCSYIDKVSTNGTDTGVIYDLILAPKYEHNPKRYLDTMAESIGLKVKDRKLFFNISDEAKKYAKQTIKDMPAVCFHTGRTWHCREWDIRKFRQVAVWIKNNYGFQMIELGRRDTQSLNIPGTIDLRGKTNYQQLAGVLAESELFVGIDSFCLHLAMACGTPVVGIYGATRPEHVEAKGSPSYPVAIETDCSGCRHRVSVIYINCSDVYCLKGISPDMVTGKIKEALGNV